MAHVGQAAVLEHAVDHDGVVPAVAAVDEPAAAWRRCRVALHPIVTFQYSSTTSYQVCFHIQFLFF
jgi:hypothetical protein